MSQPIFDLESGTQSAITVAKRRKNAAQAVALGLKVGNEQAPNSLCENSLGTKIEGNELCENPAPQGANEISPALQSLGENSFGNNRVERTL